MQDPREWADESTRLHPTREPSRSMTTAEFLGVVRDHLQGRYCSVGAHYNEDVNEARRQVGIGEHCTLWIATISRRDDLFPIPVGSMPYSSIRGEWDEDRERWKENNKVVRGWRSSLEELSKNGYLRPSRRLSYLIGRDSWKVVPRRYWE